MEYHQEKRMDVPEMNTRFDTHPPLTQDRQDTHDLLREAFKSIAILVLERVPRGREQSLAVSRLEEASFWANAGVARQPDGDDCPEYRPEKP